MYGIFLWELFSRTTPPYPPYLFIEEGVISGKLRPAEIDEYMCPSSVWDLMKKCWAQDPSQRPAMKEVCRTLDKIISDAIYGSFYKKFNLTTSSGDREDGKTKLHLAAESGNAVLVDQLLLMGDVAIVSIKDKSGKTALDYAQKGDTLSHKRIVNLIEEFIMVKFYMCTCYLF